MAAPAHYTRTAVTLHWLVAGLVLATWFMGWTMTDLAISPQRLKLYNYHKWLGVTVLALALLRLWWRLTHRPPPLPSMPRWQVRAATVAHGALYLLMLVVPLTGWIYSNAAGYRVVYLGKLPLPDLVARNRELAATWVEVHSWLAIAFAALVAVHVLGALHHQFIVKDHTLRRMLVWLG
ncbi:MAG: cytochrome b [Steroidobacteraceae bacterium]